MHLIINGEDQVFVEDITVAMMLTSLGLDQDLVAVERNLEIVHRSTYKTTILADGDRIEIVHFIGGGGAGDIDRWC